MDVWCTILMLLCSMGGRVLFIDRIYYNIIIQRLCVEITVVLLLVFASISRRQSTIIPSLVVVDIIIILGK